MAYTAQKGTFCILLRNIRLFLLSVRPIFRTYLGQKKNPDSYACRLHPTRSEFFIPPIRWPAPLPMGEPHTLIPLEVFRVIADRWYGLAITESFYAVTAYSIIAVTFKATVTCGYCICVWVGIYSIFIIYRRKVHTCHRGTKFCTLGRFLTVRALRNITCVNYFFVFHCLNFLEGKSRH